MNISPTTNQTFTALVPKSEYKGVILKLTKKDEEKIAKLISQKSEYIFELNAIERLLEKKKTIIESSGLFHRRSNIESHIRNIDEQIKAIKINRFEKQQGRAKTLDLMV